MRDNLPNLLPGLSAQESKAYLALLELGTSSVKPLAEKAGLKRTSIYNFIGRLVDLGLVTTTLKNGRNYYTASNPKRILELQQSSLSDAERILPTLTEKYNSAGPRPRVNYFEGASQVVNILQEEWRCKNESLYVWPGREGLEAIGGAAAMNKIDRQRIKRGVWVRTIRFKKKDVHYGLSMAGPKYLREMRWAPPGIIPEMGIGIYDTGKVGFFSSQHGGFGVLIESKEMQDTMTALFRLLWASSVPAREGEG
jgi:sugar-specific transcriptional regulator TrmB